MIVTRSSSPLLDQSKSATAVLKAIVTTAHNEAMGRINIRRPYINELYGNGYHHTQTHVPTEY